MVPGNTRFYAQKVFHSPSVKFSKDQKSIAAIGDRDTNGQVNEAKLEPKILSSVAAEGDGRRKTVTFNDIPAHLIKAITTTEVSKFFKPPRLLDSGGYWATPSMRGPSRSRSCCSLALSFRSCISGSNSRIVSTVACSAGKSTLRPRVSIRLPKIYV